MEPMTEDALHYLAAGWPPIPLCWPAPDGRCACGRGHIGRDIGKAPLLGKGYQLLRPNEDDVRGWWQQWPHANVGLLLEPSGLLVIDLDGPEAVSEAQRRGLLATRTIRRGDHRHLYYRRPDGCPATRTTKRGACRSIDVLTAGYLVAAPSLHASGDRYEVADDREPGEPPAWAVAMLERPRSAPMATPPVTPADVAPLSERMEQVLRYGSDADPLRYPSRSEAVFGVITAMIRAGHADSAIVGTLAAQPWVAEMRPHIERWLTAEVARAHGKGATPKLRGWIWGSVDGNAAGTSRGA